MLRSSIAAVWLAVTYLLIARVPVTVQLVCLFYALHWCTHVSLLVIFSDVMTGGILGDPRFPLLNFSLSHIFFQKTPNLRRGFRAKLKVWAPVICSVGTLQLPAPNVCNHNAAAPCCYDRLRCDKWCALENWRVNCQPHIARSQKILELF